MVPKIIACKEITKVRFLFLFIKRKVTRFILVRKYYKEEVKTYLEYREIPIVANK